MDALIIVIFFLLLPILTIGSFSIIEYRRKQVVKRILEKTIDQLAAENELFSVDAEFFRNKLIGIDKKNKKLVYAGYRKGVIDQFCIDLKLLSFCSVNKIIDNGSNGLKKIVLEVKCKGINRIFKLTLYDRSFDNIRAKGLLLRKAEQWKNKIDLYKRPVTFNTQFEYVL